MAIPDAGGLDAALERAEIEAAFWEERADDLGRRYPDQFVAVYDGEVVAVAPHLRDVLDQLQAKGLDARHTWLRFMAVNPHRFVL